MVHCSQLLVKNAPRRRTADKTMTLLLTALLLIYIHTSSCLENFCSNENLAQSEAECDLIEACHCQWIRTMLRCRRLHLFYFDLGQPIKLFNTPMTRLYPHRLFLSQSPIVPNKNVSFCVSCRFLELPKRITAQRGVCVCVWCLNNLSRCLFTVSCFFSLFSLFFLFISRHRLQMVHHIERFAFWLLVRALVSSLWFSDFLSAAPTASVQPLPLPPLISVHQT